MKYKVIKTFYTIDGTKIVKGKTFNEGEDGVKRKEIKYKDILLKEGYLKEVKEVKSLELDNKKNTKIEKDNKVDPICFGSIKETNKLFIIGDWIDDECDFDCKKLQKIVEVNNF